MELSVPDIDGVDARRAPFEEHLREPAGRGADVERRPTLRRIAEMIERRASA